MKVLLMNRALIAAALSVALLVPAAQAAQPKFFDNLSGSWSGSGQAYVKKYGDISANCRVAIKGADSKIAMDGTCGMLVFRQALGLSSAATSMWAPIPAPRPALPGLKAP